MLVLVWLCQQPVTLPSGLAGPTSPSSVYPSTSFTWLPKALGQEADAQPREGQGGDIQGPLGISLPVSGLEAPTARVAPAPSLTMALTRHLTT